MNEASSFTSRVIHHLSGVKTTKNAQFIVMGLALCSCVATLIVMHFGSGVLRAAAILPYLYLNLALLILIAIFIVKRVVVLWLDRKRGIRGLNFIFT